MRGKYLVKLNRKEIRKAKSQRRIGSQASSGGEGLLITAQYRSLPDRNHQIHTRETITRSCRIYDGGEIVNPTVSSCLVLDKKEYIQNNKRDGT